MQYISPFKELGIDIKDISKNGLQLAKKKLLADIDLSPTQTILRGGKEMTKNDVLKSFDSLAAIDNWDFHKWIAEDNTLSAFLEQQTFISHNTYKKNENYENPDFIRFISPYFTYSFQKVALQALKDVHPFIIEQLWYNLPDFMTDYDAENIDLAIETFILNRINQIEGITDAIEAGQKYKLNEIKKFYDENWISCLNNLPPFFQYLRDNYAIALYNLSANSWNKSQQRRAISIINAAQTLKLSEYEAQLVEERIVYFDDEDYGWMSFLFKWADRRVFKKTNFFTNILAWLMQIIAYPIVALWRFWEKIHDFLDQYILGKIVGAVGRFVLSLVTIWYLMWVFATTSSVFFIFDTDTKKNDKSISNLNMSDPANNYVFINHFIEKTKKEVIENEEMLNKSLNTQNYLLLDSLRKNLEELKNRKLLYEQAEEILKKIETKQMNVSTLADSTISQSNNFIQKDTFFENYKQRLNDVANKQFSYYTFKEAIGRKPKDSDMQRVYEFMQKLLPSKMDSVRQSDSLLSEFIKTIPSSKLK